MAVVASRFEVYLVRLNPTRGHPLPAISYKPLALLHPPLAIGHQP